MNGEFAGLGVPARARLLNTLLCSALAQNLDSTGDSVASVVDFLFFFLESAFMITFKIDKCEWIRCKRKVQMQLQKAACLLEMQITNNKLRRVGYHQGQNQTLLYAQVSLTKKYQNSKYKYIFKIFYLAFI